MGQIKNVLRMSTDDLQCPFSEVSPSLSDSELRETAYEVFVGSCRNLGGKQLTYISQSDKAQRYAPSISTVSAVMKAKRVWGLKASNPDSKGSDGHMNVEELVRVRMMVSERIDSRIRRAFLRVSAGKLGRRIEAMVLPLEMLQQLKLSEFINRQEYEACQTRYLKVLEAGMLLHPHPYLENMDTSSQELQQIICRTLYNKPFETSRSNESMQALRNIVMTLACRSFNGNVSTTCHWADGFPINFRMYQLLLEACFNNNDPGSIVNRDDEVLEHVKKTWVVFGINQMLHNVCFTWALLHNYAITGQVENGLLLTADKLLAEVEKDSKASNDSFCSKILCSMLSSILNWAEKSLFSYHDTFYGGNVDAMQGFINLGVSAAKILVDCAAQKSIKKRKKNDVARDKIDTYIRSSMCAAFTQTLEKAISRRKVSKTPQNSLPILTSLAQDVSELAFNETETFTQILRKWHPLACSVAVATLHRCYGNELKKYLSDINELTPDAVNVLLAAEKLEKVLANIAVEDSVDSEDGGKSIIQEMSPYEAEYAISSLVKSWIGSRVDRMKELIESNLQQEAWNPQANKEHFAASAIKVLRTIDETLEAFFLLPISMHPLLLPGLLNGLDGCLQHYILKTKSGCGNRSTYVPTLPALTRCRRKKGKKEKPEIMQRISDVGTTDSYSSSGTPQLYVRINTLQHIREEIKILEKRTSTRFQNSGYLVDDNPDQSSQNFKLSEAACDEGTRQLCEAAAYKVIFFDLHTLWDDLYVGEISQSRLCRFLPRIEQNLVFASSIVCGSAQNRVVTEIMKASFDGFVMVLLGGGPTRAFTRQDSLAIEGDFKCLKDLFWSDGDGLSRNLIDRHSNTVQSVLPLLSADTDILIKKLNVSDKSRPALPPTSGNWSPSDLNTVLRVLCYRDDEKASKFLMKTYNLPKN